MNKSEIIECLVNHFCDGNKSQFANLLGVKPQTINTWINRNSFDVDLVYSKCEGVSGDWLISGEGNMIKGENPQNNYAEEIERLKSEIERLKTLKTPQGVDKLYDLWMRFMVNQSQYQEIMREMASIYGNSK